MKNKLIVSLALLTLTGPACHHANRVQVLDERPCQTLTARADYQILGHAGQSTALIASCQNQNWRLVMKADWGSTFVDLLTKNGKLSILQQPMGVPTKQLKNMSQALGQALSAAELGPEIKLTTPGITIDFTILSQKELAAEQRQKLLME